jgi:hypothetical protein
MKKAFNICLFVVLFLLVIFQAIIINKKSFRIKELQVESFQLTNNIGILKSNTVDIWKYQQTILNEDQIVDEDGRSLSEDCFDFENPVLICRFSKLNCSNCIEKQVGMLLKLIESKVKYMLIGDYSNKRELGIFKRVNEIKDIVYACEIMLTSEQRTPYFCVFFRGVVSDVFFPDEKFPELTQSYLKEMTTKYFSDN